MIFFSICQPIRYYSVRQHNGKDLWNFFFFSFLLIKSQGISWFHMTFDLFPIVQGAIHTSYFKYLPWKKFWESAFFSLMTIKEALNSHSICRTGIKYAGTTWCSDLWNISINTPWEPWVSKYFKSKTMPNLHRPLPVGLFNKYSLAI